MSATASGTTDIGLRDRYRAAIARFVTGIAVVTAAESSQTYGTTVSAVTSVTLEPPTLLTCLNKQSVTGRAVARTGTLGLNVLNESQADLVARFAAKGTSKFDGVPVQLTARGIPLLDDAIACFECRVVRAIEAGSHVIFLAEVETAASRPDAPLAYFGSSYYRLGESLCLRRD